MRLDPSLFNTNVSESRTLKELNDLFSWALKEFHAQMFAHMSFVNGPEKYSDVIPWLLNLEGHFNPPPQISLVPTPNGDSETVPVRRHRRNSTSIPSLTPPYRVDRPNA